ncbi:MAG: hypothetical protein JXA07_07125 [Spirochaetes bacterium]|nr:hypothetical protein [Spirochaetota bacterium]
MGEHFEQIPQSIQGHIKDILKTSGLPDTEESLDAMSEAWLKKKEAFETEIGELDMEEVDTLARDDTHGALVLTYSGSLVNIGPLSENGRKVEYVSIGLRQDVPESATEDNASLAGDVYKDEEIEFDMGPVQVTSAAYKIALCKNPKNAKQETRSLSKATMILSNKFSDINKTVIGSEY